MLTIEAVVTFSGLVVGFGIVFLWGVRIGRNLQYKEVQNYLVIYIQYQKKL